MKLYFFLTYGVLLMSLSGLNSAHADIQQAKIEILKTTTNVRFGILGSKPAKPAPTLFIFAAKMEDSLGEKHFRQCGNTLAEKGYLCVSLDMPCHGLDARADEPQALDGWRYRIDHNEPIITEFTNKVTDILNYLIAQGFTDPQKVAVCGTSRGGFFAAHAAAAEPRIKCVAMFKPVTDLTKLREFNNSQQPAAAKSLGLVNFAPKLAGRDIWLVIGDQDARVDTDSAIAFARKLSQVSAQNSRIELHVLPDPRGHTIPDPDGSAQQAATWIINLLGQGQ